MKIIHCADLHLDTAFSGLGDGKNAAIRQAELRRTFHAIINLAKEADVLIISGDLFDQDSVEAETIHSLAAGFASLGEKPVFIAAGNHDPLTEKSYYRLAAFSPNVHIFGPELERITYGGCDFYGISFSSNLQDEPLLETFRAEQNRPSVLMMHGDLGGGPYNPISREWIEKSGLSYLALGHVHSFSEYKIGNTLCVYPGCPEGRGFDELDEKGVASVTLNESGATVHFVPTCQRTYREISVDVSGVLTHEEIIQKLAEQITNESDLYKIILQGETELIPNGSIISEAFSNCFFVKIKDRTRRVLHLDMLLKDSGIRGMFARKLEAGLSGEQAEGYRKALEYGLAALNGEKVKLQ